MLGIGWPPQKDHQVVAEQRGQVSVIAFLDPVSLELLGDNQLDGLTFDELSIAKPCSEELVPDSLTKPFDARLQSRRDGRRGVQ